MKTIRQIADEIGVSKQAVYKRYKGKLHTVCAPYAHTEQGVLYLSEQAETLIKQDFLKDNRSNGAHTDTRTERSIGAVLEQSQEAGVVAVLQATIDTLQGQLEVKDRQIEQQTQTITRLTDALAAAQQTAAAAQALHAGTIQRQLQAAEKVRVGLDAIQPEKTLTGAVKGVTVEQVKELKAAAIRGAAAEQKVKELKVENQQLHSRIPSMKEKLKEAEERQRLINENRNLQVQVEYLENSLDSERNFASRLLEGVEAVLDFLDRHLPEQFRPMLERARELLPVPELQQPEQEQDRGHTWGGMEL